MLKSNSLALLARLSLPGESQRWSVRMGLLALVWLLLALILAPWDMVIASWMSEGHLPGDLRRLLSWSEVFAHGLGIALIGLVTAWLDPARRRFWSRILLTAYSAGLLANLVKLGIGRLRPSAYLSLSSGSDSVAETFAGLVPGVLAHRWSDFHGHAIQSFPSAHAATGFAFASALWMVYPRVRALIAALAVLSALQRVDATAHWPSDVLCGAALGCATAALWTYGAVKLGVARENRLH